MEPQRYTPEERHLFEQEVEQILRTELPGVREEEVRTAARRAAARELEQQRDVLRDQLDDQVVAITEEPADLRAAANRQAPSKVLLGAVLLLLLLFTLAVLGRLPNALAAFGSGSSARSAQASNTNTTSFTSALGAGAASGAPIANATPTPSATRSASGQANASAVPSTAAPSASLRPRMAMLPQTGVDTTDLFVDPLFGQVYWQQGGPQRFGRATSALITVNGQQTQTFEHARFVYRPEHAGTPDAVVIEFIK